MNQEVNKRVAIYIDGSNLYHKLKKLGVSDTLKFDYKAFCQFLGRGREITSCRYYVGVVKAKENDNRSQELRRYQQKLFSCLENCDIVIKRGYLMENEGKFHEKGVDVKIATDLLIGAYENYYDIAILVSSDTDLIPAIKHIKYLKKEIEYIGFSNSPSFGLQKYANNSILLLKEDVEKYIYKTLL